MNGPDPLAVACTYCGAAQGELCKRQGGGTHPTRRKRARKAWTPPDRCRCTNHLGSPKIQHHTREAAVAWMAHRARTGMRYEPYPCPTSPGIWHVRTARVFHPGAV